MKLIVGLGNPGRQYADTRHNLGFQVVDVLAGRWGIAVDKSKFHGLFGEGQIADQRVSLLKPMTYMNRSGRSVGAAWRFYKLPPEDVLIILDDLDLPVGRLRFRSRGSAGGHRGLDDVIRALGTNQVARLRMGIGRAPGDDSVSHVLSHFAPDEREVAQIATQQAADAVECWLAQGPEATMNRYNRKVDESEPHQ